MLLRTTISLLPLMAVVQAFQKSSPFLMLSNEALDKVMFPVEVQQAEKVEAAVTNYYSDKTACQSGRHILISQPGLTTTDLQSLPKLASQANSAKLPWKLTIPSVIGEVDAGAVRQSMEDVCGRAVIVKQGMKSTKDKLAVYMGESLPMVKQDRQDALEKLDAQLASLLDPFPSSGPYVIVLISTPQEAQSDSYQGIIHQELKRSVEVDARASNSSKSNSTSDNFQDGLPLFERYAYFSPALFMGFAVSILLLSILYIGISAIAGLEVSYGAFSKEMAPQNQKKQQ